ncbi:MAG: hypothetical protein JRE70_17555, partial [Deltaproteobacteria bacterium]|nr:hypothetical protein [Deltaproteobacteria bacterium]
MLKLSRRLRTLLAWSLTLQICFPSTSLWAAGSGPSDGTTVHGMRGEVGGAGVGFGRFGAGGSSGAATYSVPIQAAVGTGGLTPELALSYNSRARTDSWVGYGWSLGLPSVSRSLTNGVPTYDDQIDIFAFAGMELVPEDSNPALPRTYHTRRETFLRIVHESDDSWTVTRKDSSRLRFGITDNALVSRPGGDVFQWLLSEQEDVHGNVIAASYDTQDTGSPYLEEIRYTLRRQSDQRLESLDGDPSRDRVIAFVLETTERDDIRITYSAGFRSELRHRLDYIDIRAAGALIRRYDLVYSESADSFRSLFNEIHEYGADADEPTPTPPFITTFKYRSNIRDATTGWQEISWPWPSNVSLMDGVGKDGGARLGDVDGDGLPDLIKLRYTLTNSSLEPDSNNGVYRSLGDGFSPIVSFLTPVDVGQFDPAFALNDTQLGTNTTYSLGTTPVDLTGDGRVDLVGAWNVLYYHWWGGWPGVVDLPWFVSNGSGFDQASSHYYDENLSTSVSGLWAPALEIYVAVAGNTTFADLTGDGLPELINRGAEAIFTDPDTGSYRCDTAIAYSYVAYNEGNLQFTQAPTTTHSANVDSTAPPGLPVCTPGNALRTTPLYEGYPGPLGSKLIRSSEFEPCNPAIDSSCHLRLYHNARAVTQGNWIYGCNTSIDLRYQTSFNCNPFYIDSHHQFGNYEVDINSDGLADVISAFSAGVTSVRAAALNNGDKGFDTSNSWAPPEDLLRWSSSDYFSEDRGWRFADVNGDGRIDLIRAQFIGDARGTLLNDGDVGQAGDTGPWRSENKWNLPQDGFFVNQIGGDHGGRMVDMNGDGMIDFIFSLGSVSRVWLNRGRVPDLLEEVSNPLGGAIKIEYTPSTSYSNKGADSDPDLPQIMQVVSEVSVDDGRDEPIVTSYSYRDGMFDALRREFRGFGRVTATNAEGTKTTTQYHQTDALTGRRRTRQRERRQVAACPGLRKWR